MKFSLNDYNRILKITEWIRRPRIRYFIAVGSVDIDRSYQHLFRIIPSTANELFAHIPLLPYSCLVLVRAEYMGIDVELMDIVFFSPFFFFFKYARLMDDTHLYNIQDVGIV